MGIMDTMRWWIKTWTEKVSKATENVGDFIEKKASTLVDHIPGGKTFKEKANTYTEKTVNRIGDETKTMVKEWKDAVEKFQQDRKAKKEAEKEAGENAQEKAKKIKEEVPLGKDIVSAIQEEIDQQKNVT